MVRNNTAGRRSTLFNARRRFSELPLRGIQINISSDPFQHRIPPHLQRVWQESRIVRFLASWRSRLIKRYQISSTLELLSLLCSVIVACLLLLMHVGFFSGKKYQDWQYEHYGGGLDQVDLLEKLYPDDGRGLTTAILLFSPRDQWSIAQEAKETLTPIIEQLCQYDMFATFLIWNNNPLVNMTPEAVEAKRCSKSKKIAVHNSASNMYTVGRYFGCLLTETPYCYFQDQAGQRHLRSLYANFLRHPHLIHGESRDTIAHAQARWRWCFFNDAFNLHACHAQVGYGTLVSKSNVEKFIQLLELDPIDVRFSDMYFMTYANQPPYQLEGPPGIFPDTEDREQRVLPHPNLTDIERHHVYNGIISLYHHLERQTGLFPTEERKPAAHEQSARTSCYNDRCLFLTNVESFPDRRIIAYNPNLDLYDLERVHDQYYDTGTHYIKYPYHHAVDGNDHTAWKSRQHIKAGDYIGLDLLMPMRIPLRYRLLARQPYAFRQTLRLQMSYNSKDWMTIQPVPSIQCDAVDDSTLEVPLLECQFTVTETGYRFIRLESTQDLNVGYELYDFSFGTRVKRDINGQLLDFSVDDNGIPLFKDDPIHI